MSTEPSILISIQNAKLYFYRATYLGIINLEPLGEENKTPQLPEKIRGDGNHWIYRMSHKKGTVRAAHDFNSQFLNLFRFSISVSFVRCII